MEERPVILTFETAKTMYESKDGVLMSIASKTFPELLNSDFPKSWEELCELKKGEEGYCITAVATISSTEFSTKSQYSGTVSTKERIETMLLLQQLLEIRDEWNKIDDNFVPIWNNTRINFCVTRCYDDIQVEDWGSYPHFFVFRTHEIASDFMITFREELLKIFSIC